MFNSALWVNTTLHVFLWLAGRKSPKQKSPNCYTAVTELTLNTHFICPCKIPRSPACHSPDTSQQPPPPPTPDGRLEPSIIGTTQPTKNKDQALKRENKSSNASQYCINRKRKKQDKILHLTIVTIADNSFLKPLSNATMLGIQNNCNTNKA